MRDGHFTPTSDNFIIGEIRSREKFPFGVYPKDETYSKKEVDELIEGISTNRDESVTNEDVDKIFDEIHMDLTDAEIVDKDDIDDMFEDVGVDNNDRIYIDNIKVTDADEIDNIFEKLEE